jgi:large subunit ribosomal protein L31
VLFVDTSTGHKYLCGTTLKANDKEVFEGKEYPMCRVAISATSHPFFVGGKQLLDTEGRVDKFNKRYQAAKLKAQEFKEESEEKEKEALAEKAKKKKK